MKHQKCYFMKDTEIHWIITIDHLLSFLGLTQILYERNQLNNSNVFQW